MNWNRTRSLAVFLSLCYLLSLAFVYLKDVASGLDLYYLLGQVVALGFSVGLAFLVATELVRNHSPLLRIPVSILVGLVLSLGLLFVRWAVVPSTDVGQVLLKNWLTLIGFYTVSLLFLELLVRSLTSGTGRGWSEY